MDQHLGRSPLMGVSLALKRRYPRKRTSNPSQSLSTRDVHPPKHAHIEHTHAATPMQVYTPPCAPTRVVKVFELLWLRRVRHPHAPPLRVPPPRRCGEPVLHGFGVDVGAGEALLQRVRKWSGPCVAFGTEPAMNACMRACTTYCLSHAIYTCPQTTLHNLPQRWCSHGAPRGRGEGLVWGFLGREPSTSRHRGQSPAPETLSCRAFPVPHWSRGTGGVAASGGL
jgi:hypothetical protein